MNKIQFLIRGETELALNEIANCIDKKSYAFSFLLYNKKVTYINYGIKNKEHINFLLDKKSFLKIDDKDIKKIISLSKNNYKLNLNQKGY